VRKAVHVSCSVLDHAANLGCILIIQPSGKTCRQGVSQAAYLHFFF
jgi:hypothetical protein